MADVKFKNVVVFGAGTVGALAANMLHKEGFNVTSIDMAAKPYAHLSDGVTYKQMGVSLKDGKIQNLAELQALLKDAKAEAMLCTLPHDFVVPLANLAMDSKLSYFAPTEDVEAVKAIQKKALESDAKGKGLVVAPQCGLAPGLASHMAMHLATDLKRIDEMQMRVGALPDHPDGKLQHNLTWSPDGMFNEYLKIMNTVRNGKAEQMAGMHPSLDQALYVGNQKFVIGGTSGGDASMPELATGKIEGHRLAEQHVKNESYRTIRFPDHWNEMRALLKKYGWSPDNPAFYDAQGKFSETLYNKELGDFEASGKKDEAYEDFKANMGKDTKEDQIVFHVRVKGVTKSGKKVDRVATHTFRPQVIIEGQPAYKAISWTTAAGIVGVMAGAARGDIKPGFQFQEDMTPTMLWQGHIKEYYAHDGLVEKAPTDYDLTPKQRKEQMQESAAIWNEAYHHLISFPASHAALRETVKPLEEAFITLALSTTHNAGGGKARKNAFRVIDGAYDHLGEAIKAVEGNDEKANATRAALREVQKITAEFLSTGNHQYVIAEALKEKELARG